MTKEEAMGFLTDKGYNDVVIGKSSWVKSSTLERFEKDVTVTDLIIEIFEDLANDD
jgi:hypothetical protein